MSGSLRRRCLAVLVIIAGGLSIATGAGAPPVRPLPPVTPGLLRVDARGGRVLRWEGLEDLTRPAARWSGNGSWEMLYTPVGDGRGAYRLSPKDRKVYPMMSSEGSLHLKPNRSYVVSVLLYADFPRPSEVNMGVWNYPTGDYRGFLFNLNGIPNSTQGWQRWEWEFPADVRCGDRAEARFYFQPYGLPEGNTLAVADVALVELPVRPLTPNARGAGVTFRGGPGALPMRIEGVERMGRTVHVRTTGARYTFDGETDTIRAEQLLETRREVAEWRSSLPLDGLTILSTTPRECVVANDHITLGVQCDGLVMVSPQQPVTLTLRSKIGGRWNRFIDGHLLAIDDLGGLAVNPDIPFGTGRLPRTHVLTDGLDFVGVENDVAFLSAAAPGWQIAWEVDPGERLGLSIFPPRPFDWKQSFHMNWALTFREADPSRYQEWGRYLDVAVLWDFCQRSWGMSWGPSWVPSDEAALTKHIAALKAAGVRPITYMSMYFYYSRNPQEYLDNIRRFRDRYGIEGVYSDGDPSPEWVVAYEEMRMLRELFPDGVIILHTTGQPGNGGPPLSEPDIFIPAIDTYATATFRGEWAQYEGGIGWLYPRYVSSQYRKANCIGIQKGDRWENVPQLTQDLLNLRYNGRASHWPGLEPSAESRDRYLPALRELEQLWQEKGDDPAFYERYYRPRVELLTPDLVLPEDSLKPGRRGAPW